MKTITWTPDKLARFRKHYKQAVTDNVDTFVFEDDTFVVGYAKYLIEYLEQRLAS